MGKRFTQLILTRDAGKQRAANYFGCKFFLLFHSAFLTLCAFGFLLHCVLLASNAKLQNQNQAIHDLPQSGKTYIFFPPLPMSVVCISGEVFCDSRAGKELKEQTPPLLSLQNHPIDSFLLHCLHCCITPDYNSWFVLVFFLTDKCIHMM